MKTLDSNSFINSKNKKDNNEENIENIYDKKNIININNKESSLLNEINLNNHFKNELPNINSYSITNSLIGIEKIDNNCYMNCGLQILFHIKIFIEELYKKNNISNKKVTQNIIDLCNNVMILYNKNLKVNIK